MKPMQQVAHPSEMQPSIVERAFPSLFTPSDATLGGVEAAVVETSTAFQLRRR